ncbi:hypothetical protein CBF34_05105 [Vagococcus penaei]|uniref:Uncharacterized protein n=1 Tax=Vagococcus penaei TaxID=633807 RepID=A0A1Q2D6N7_9ENTE|nr:pectate lyase-like adhesive domain-containing protein [Vagococcus penaei]AQP53935.1 hypothetical protein BW732_06685 [Vagococcus penaei]RSU02901.1 hypothetical protein CBF34_05105 [Vagococcus penaei]
MRKKSLLITLGLTSILFFSMVHHPVIGYAIDTDEDTLVQKAQVRDNSLGKQQFIQIDDSLPTTDFSDENLFIKGYKNKNNLFNNLEEYQLNTDGTGIIAKNIGKEISEIQALNGDKDALKKLILTDNEAKAYGLLGGKRIDVTDQIIIDDLKGLEQATANGLEEYKIQLRVPAEVTGTGIALMSEVIVYVGKVTKVHTWDELDKAFMSNDIQIIDVQNSMTNIHTNRSDRVLADNRSDYVLLGNGHSLDFLGYSYKWGNNTNITHKPIIDNVDMYGGHYFGPVTMWDRNGYGSSITYRNVNYTGSQVTASFQAVIRFEGKNNIRSSGSQYTSYDGIVRNMAGGGDNDQSGLESHTLVFGENTDTLIEVTNGDGVILGSWYSDWDEVSRIQPSMTVEENANATIRTLGNAGESNSWQTTGGTIPSVISMQRNGKITVGKKANLTIETADGTTRVPIRMGYNTSVPKEWQTSIEIGEDSQLNINANGPIETASSRAAIMMQDSSLIDIGRNSKLTLNANNMTTGAPVISMGRNANIKVDEAGQFLVDKTNGRGRILDLSAGSNFLVSDEGIARFRSTGEVSSTDAMIHGGRDSSFIVGDRGIFESTIVDGATTRNMLDFDSNATFTFANARKVDLDGRGNPNAELISMTQPGKFTADIQEVMAWKNEDSNREEPTFTWTPMYGIKVDYNGSKVTKASGNSVTKPIQDSFIDNYRTENFSRVLYNYIPDVVLRFDEPSDNRELTNGRELTGVVNNNAALQFYLVKDENDASQDVLLTRPTVPSPVEGDSRLFHTIADGDGKFTYVLPENLPLRAGEKIKAYAWLNGKDATEVQTVVDKTPPTGEGKDYVSFVGEELPDPSIFVQNPQDTNPKKQNFTYEYVDRNAVLELLKKPNISGEDVSIYLYDDAKNRAVVTGSLKVYKQASGINANTPVTLSYSDIKEMDDQTLSNYIIMQSQPSGYSISDGQLSVWKDTIKFKVTDLGELKGLQNLVSDKDYPVTLALPKEVTGLSADITETIVVNIINLDAILTIEFQDESGQVLTDYTMTIGHGQSIDQELYVGDTLDLTQPEYSAIDKQLNTLETTGYAISMRPDNETKVKIDATEQTLIYQVNGQLFFQSTPSTIDFGKLTYNARKNRVDNPKIAGDLVIADTRANKSKGWRLTATLENDMHNPKTGSVMSESLQYVTHNGELIVLNKEENIIYQNDNGGTYDITNDWGNTGTTPGLKLIADPRKTTGSNIGNYQTTIIWTVTADQP